MRSIQTIKNYFNALIHLLYPSICVVCARALNNQERTICIPCCLSLPLTTFHLITQNPLEKKFWGREDIQTVNSLLFMEKHSITEKLIYALKYQNREDVGEFLAEQCIARYKSYWQNTGINAIVCIPLHSKRQKQRGYNQCNRFCQSLSASLGIPFYADAMVRLSFQSSQTQMSRTSRWENVKDAFQLTDKNDLNGKKILLVDDVLTTGATLEACVASINKSCNAKVHIFTMACKI